MLIHGWSKWDPQVASIISSTSHIFCLMTWCSVPQECAYLKSETKYHRWILLGLPRPSSFWNTGACTHTHMHTLLSALQVREEILHSEIACELKSQDCKMMQPHGNKAYHLTDVAKPLPYMDLIWLDCPPLPASLQCTRTKGLLKKCHPFCCLYRVQVMWLVMNAFLSCHLL